MIRLILVVSLMKSIVRMVNLGYNLRIIDQCIVAAITNYTDQLRCVPAGRFGVFNVWSHRRKAKESHYTYSNETALSVALKFVVHFIGDILQPLHLCKRGTFVLF